MKLLLTSAGITNDSIRKALIDMLGKPIAQPKAIERVSTLTMNMMRLPR